MTIGSQIIKNKKSKIIKPKSVLSTEISKSLKDNHLTNQGKTKALKEKLELLKKASMFTLLVVGGLFACKLAFDNFGTGTGGENWDYTENGRYPETSPENKIKNKIIDEANRQGVDASFALAVAESESHFNPKAHNKSGAAGLFQIMPMNYKSFGIDPYNEDQNIQVGIKLLKGYLDRYGGDKQKALYAYNWGPGNLAKYGIANAPKETVNYYKLVSARADKFKTELESQRPQGVYVSSIRGFRLQNKNVRISKMGQSFLAQTEGSGIVTSGMEGSHSRSSSGHGHYEGYKIDLVANSPTVASWGDLIINLLKNPRTERINLEIGSRGFTNNQYDAIYNYVKTHSSNLPYNKIRKINQTSNTSGRHLDVTYSDDNYNLSSNNINTSTRLSFKSIPINPVEEEIEETIADADDDINYNIQNNLQNTMINNNSHPSPIYGKADKFNYLNTSRNSMKPTSC